jgi:hypothetical protein
VCFALPVFHCCSFGCLCQGLSQEQSYIISQVTA